MRAVFFGTPDIAATALAALCDIADVRAVVCQPDRPAGRGMKLMAPAVKLRALERGIEVAQPTKIKTPEFLAWLSGHRADVALVIAYGRILPKAVLDAPQRGCMNLHASLLPKYRGAAPINWAIARGETETGVSLMQMDEGMDTGPVYAVRKLSIGPDETAGELYERLAALSAEVVRRDLADAVAGKLEATPQDAVLATTAPLLKKDDGAVDWMLPAAQVHDRARGMTPWPGAHCSLDGKRFKLLRTRLSAADANGEPGEVIALDAARALVACGEGAIEILQGQVEGRKPLDAGQLAAGRTLAVGSRFG